MHPRHWLLPLLLLAAAFATAADLPRQRAPLAPAAKSAADAHAILELDRW